MSDTPAWYTPDTTPAPVAAAAPVSAPVAAAPQGSPAWYTPDTTTPAVPAVPAPTPTHPTEKRTGNNYTDALNFVRTAATKALAGAAAAVGTGAADLATGFNPAVNNIAPGMQQATEDTLFKNTAPEYVPTSTPGRYGMSALTMAIPAMIGDPALALPNAARGAAAGVATQAAQDNNLPPWLGPLATFGGELLARKAIGLRAPHTTAGVQSTGAKITNELPAVPANAVPALPGLNVSTGQVTGNQQWLALDKEFPDQDQTATTLAGNQNLTRGALGTVAPGPTGSDAASAQAANITAARKIAQQRTQTAWDAIPPDVSVSTGPLKTTLAQHVQGITANGDDDLLPTNVVDQISKMDDTVPLSQLQARRSRLVTAASDARANGNNNSARVIGGVADLVGQHIDDPSNIVTGNPQDLAVYNNARNMTRDFHSTFGDDGTAGVPMSDVTGNKIAAESTLGRILPPGSEGSGAASLSKLKLASGTGAGLDPARSYVIGKLQDAVGQGADAYDKAMSDYGYAINDRDMFTGAQRQTINDAHDAVTQMYRRAAPGADVGSPTFSKLSGGSFARVLYGNILGAVVPRVAKTVGSLAGGFAAAHSGLPPGAVEITGNLMGGEAAGQASSNSMNAARTNIMNVVKSARNPVVARQLQMQASSQNLRMAPALRNSLKTLGIDETMALPASDPSSGQNQ